MMVYMKNKKIIIMICSIIILIAISIFSYQKEFYPTIKLNGKNILVIDVGNEYIEKGFKVYKGNKEINVEVKIKNNIKVNTIGVYTIEYFFKYYDRKISAIRKVKVVDNIKPNIELIGGSEINIIFGNEYHELGYTATDNYDGNITNKVEIKNNIQNKIGKYEINYKVSDSSGNINIKTRIVNVIENHNGIIYLTFDDGPSNITSKVLDILKKEKIKATFFVIGFNNNMNNVVTRIVNEGHTIALHSYSHAYSKIYSSAENYFYDLELLENKIKDITGVNAKIIRFPGGSSNTVSSFNKGIMSTLTKEVLSRGYRYFDWNVSSNDAGNARNSDEVYNNVIYNLSKNRINVVLMHDFYNNYKTLNALENIIKTAKDNGYHFSNITNNTPMVKHIVNN